METTRKDSHGNGDLCGGRRIDFLIIFIDFCLPEISIFAYYIRLQLITKP